MSDAAPDSAARPTGEGDGEGEDRGDVRPWRLSEHIGVVSGWALGLVFVGFLALLAVAGDPSAFAILVVAVIGIALIYLGGRTRGSHR